MEELTEDDYLKAVGLWMLMKNQWLLAKNYEERNKLAKFKSEKYRKKLNEFLNLRDGNHVNRAVWNAGDFDKALNKENISIPKSMRGSLYD